MITSATRRFLKLGGLAGRVGASVVTSQALELVRSGPEKNIRRTENLVKNALRIVETLGELKGAAMKVGQMLSLHEGLLPPEVAEVLRGLQKEAPRVPAEVMEFEVRGALPGLRRALRDALTSRPLPRLPSGRSTGAGCATAARWRSRSSTRSSTRSSRPI